LEQKFLQQHAQDGSLRSWCKVGGRAISLWLRGRTALLHAPPHQHQLGHHRADSEHGHGDNKHARGDEQVGVAALVEATIAENCANSNTNRWVRTVSEAMRKREMHGRTVAAEILQTASRLGGEPRSNKAALWK
jgi:hypothetical protein